MSVIADDTPAEVEAYLAAVRATLSDLPPAERDDLLAEVEASLREAADDTGSIGGRLGSPQEFATELRAAAGLHESPVSARRVPLRLTIERLAAHPHVAAARRVAVELAPVWWVARAYAVIAGIAVLANSNWSTRYPAIPRVFDSAKLGVATILLAIAASVVLALRTRRDGRTLRRTVLAANIVSVALLVPALGPLGDSALKPPSYVPIPQPYAVPGLAYNGAPVQNIYPYSRDGKLLHDVLLYDAAGAPLDIGAAFQDPNRRVLKASTNASIFNSFPIRYYEPGTVLVAHPNAGPPVRTPIILPPPR
jgi:hypothetical protein